MLLVDIAAEDLHRSKTDGKREECLAKRCKYCIRKCTWACKDLREIGIEVERDALRPHLQSDRNLDH